jgi:hypothetical protein
VQTNVLSPEKKAQNYPATDRANILSSHDSGDCLIMENDEAFMANG